MIFFRFPAKLFIAVLIGLFFASFCFALGELTFPSPQGFVNDYANLLTTSERAGFEELLKNYERETSNEVSLVIVDTLQGLDIFTYSQQLFTAWNIGKKDKNNGILFLIGPKEGLPFPERGEAFINVGRGLEGALTDSRAGSIIRNETIPEFKAKNYGLGIQKGLNAIIAATKEEYVGTGDSGSGEGGGINFTGLFWVGFILLSYVASFLARTKSWWLGGVIGGVAGAILGFIFWSGIIIALSAGVLGVLGLLFDFVLSRNYQKRLAEGKKTDFWHSGGGFWFGGGRGGFGGGGGGFGGFGGGMSGGGGAGGRW